MIGRNIIVIGASAGGVQALLGIVEQLPASLNAAIFIVLHIGSSQSRLPEVLGRKSLLPVEHPYDGQAIMPGHIYVAPPDFHMMLEKNRIRLVHGPKENFTRPAIDPLFRSAALAFGTNVVGVILSGQLDDGTAGLIAVKDRGGVAIVQDPAEAVAPSMPRSAAACVAVDHVCTAGAIAQLLVNYDPAGEFLPEVARAIEPRQQVPSSAAYRDEQHEFDPAGMSSQLTCPECGAVLYQLRDERLLRFRCLSGHAMSARALLARLAASREGVIWSTIRSLTEEATLVRHIADRPNDVQADGRPSNSVDADMLIALAATLHETLSTWALPPRGP